MHAARPLGADVILMGVCLEVAQTIVSQGLNQERCQHMLTCRQRYNRHTKPALMPGERPSQDTTGLFHRDSPLCLRRGATFFAPTSLSGVGFFVGVSSRAYPERSDMENAIQGNPQWLPLPIPLGRNPAGNSTLEREIAPSIPTLWILSTVCNIAFWQPKAF
jgi:hypothetical protein